MNPPKYNTRGQEQLQLKVLNHRRRFG